MVDIQFSLFDEEENKKILNRCNKKTISELIHEKVYSNKKIKATESAPVKNKQTNGQLVYVEKNGKEIPIPGCYNLPFSLLQYKKKCFIKDGYKKEQIKIKYL